MSRKLAVLCALAMVLATAAGALGAPEFEPNNVRTQADVIGGYPCYEPGNGTINPINDKDYWVIATPKGSAFWALANAESGSVDTELRAETLGGTLLEADNDDGYNANGNVLAALIANRSTGSVRRVFLRVSVWNDAALNTYSLLATVTKGHVAEIEPNDNSLQADNAMRCPQVRSGAIGQVGDVDWFSITVPGARRIFVAADQDPTGASPTDLTLKLYDTDALTDLRTANHRGATPDTAEGFAYDLPGAGTYFVAVHEAGDNGTGDYRLLISGLPKVKCNKKYATMTGSPAADLIQGTDGGDVIASFGGADRIFGGRGGDRECGGGGGDKLYGGRGFDRLYGGGSGDKLIGGKDEDLCVGGPGSDTTKSC